MAFWYYPRVLYRARGVDFEVGLHPLNGRWQQPCCSKANLWLKFTIQETFFSSSMAFDGSLRPKESWRWHQNRILSHLFQLYVKICWEDYTRNVCYPFMTYRKSTRDQKNILQTNNTSLHSKTTHRFLSMLSTVLPGGCCLSLDDNRPAGSIYCKRRLWLYCYEKYVSRYVNHTDIGIINMYIHDTYTQSRWNWGW